MTWWEVEQIAAYIESLEESMANWTLSGMEMHTQRAELVRLDQKLLRGLQRAEDPAKKTYIGQLMARIKELQNQLQERLKRPLSSGVSRRNLLS